MVKQIHIKSLKNYSKSIGIKEIGYMSVSRLAAYEPYQSEKRQRGLNCYLSELYPVEEAFETDGVLRGAKGFIVCLFPYSLQEKKKESDGSVYLSAPSVFYDYHKQLSVQLTKLADFAQLQWNANTHILVDTHPFPERFIAKEAGLGIIGKNSYLLNKRYGTATYIGLILTDLECDSAEEIELADLCEGCNLCVEACPNQALVSGRFVNDQRCISYLTQKKTLNEWDMAHMNGFLYGCDICSKVCPYTQKHMADFTKAFESDAFFSLSELVDKELSFTKDMALNSWIDIKSLLTLSNKSFANTLKQTSAGWIGKKRLQRNGLIGIQYANQETIEDCITLISEDQREDIIAAKVYISQLI